MAKTVKAPKGPVKTVKAQPKKAGTMTTASNVKVEDAPKLEPQKIGHDETAKNIAAKATQSDQYEFDDPEEGRAVFAKLPPGEFVINEGNRTVIQKL